LTVLRGGELRLLMRRGMATLERLTELLLVRILGWDAMTRRGC
jgi:hypothetical protein